MRLLISLLLCLVTEAVFAQFRFVEDGSVPMIINNQTLARAWEGGINSAQYQKMDLNNDGTEDLVIYHRMSGELTTYLAQNNEFVYQPAYKAFFPEEVSDWLVLADYNCDGKKDIFTSTPLGIKVFENTSSGNVPDWTEAVEFISFNDGINLQVNASDIPGIADIDGDGDLDILSYRFSTSNTIDFYKNLSIENTGVCGSLTFTRETRRWGDLEECDCGSFAFGQTCASLGGVANPQNIINAPDGSEHAGGKTILPIDMDNDGDLDLITSDEFCETLYYMENKGTPDLAMMTGFESFPQIAPAAFYIFPSAFFEDVTFDGVKDLIISSNADNNIGNLIDFTTTSRLNTNSGSNTLPSFSGDYTTFLQDEMLDLGETTYPAFADVDGDSDYDLVVGNRGILNNGELIATLYLFENTGTRLQPAFTLTDADFLGFSSERFRSLKPQFVDLDGDGDLDLAYQATEIDGNRTALRYRVNQGNFDFGDENEIPLSLLENDQFHFARIDEDNHADLLIGNRLGSLTLYLNNGNLSFNEGIDDFAGISNGFETRNPSLLVADLDGDGKQEMAITDISGRLKLLTGNLSPDFTPTATVTELADNDLLTGLQPLLLGSFSPLASADLFGDGKPALVFGNSRGGLSLYRNLSTSDGGSNTAVNLFAFPNPGSRSVFLQSSVSGTLSIYTVNGQRIQQDIAIQSSEELEINTGILPAGLYLLRVTGVDGQSGTIKILVQH